MRTGVIAEKVGMMSLFQENGTRIPVTVLKIDSTVVGTRTSEKDGYTAVVLGSRPAKPKNVAKPQAGFFAKAKVEPKKIIAEFRVSEDCTLPVGSVISADHFVVGQKVDVAGVSLGKGFQGGMKRHNFSGDNATHGVSLTHRALGSTGNREWPGKVFKNRKMPGQMGNKNVTVQNLLVVAVDTDRNVIMVKGNVPGFDSNTVFITDAVKCTKQTVGPVPAGLVADKKPAEPQAQVQETVEKETTEVQGEA